MEELMGHLIESNLLNIGVNDVNASTSPFKNAYILNSIQFHSQTEGWVVLRQLHIFYYFDCINLINTSTE